MPKELEEIDELVRMTMGKLPSVDNATARALEASLREVFGGKPKATQRAKGPPRDAIAKPDWWRLVKPS